MALNDKPCAVSGRSPYYRSPSRWPYRDHGIRPTMMLAAESLDDAKRLIDRGLAADGSFPPGTAYLVDPEKPVSLTGQCPSKAS